jgi:hypothetical protein
MAEFPHWQNLSPVPGETCPSNECQQLQTPDGWHYAACGHDINSPFKSYPGEAGLTHWVHDLFLSKRLVYLKL